VHTVFVLKKVRSMQSIKQIIIRLIETMYRSRKVLLAFSCLVVFIVTYVLILPAFTLEKDEAEELGGIDVPGVEQTADEDETSAGKHAVTESGKAATDEAKETKPEKASKEDKKSKEAAAVTLQNDESEDYTIAVEGKDDVLSGDMSVNVREIDQSTKKLKKEYDSLYKDALEAVQTKQNEGGEKKASGFEFAKFYDISLMDGKTEVEPGSAVDVKISFNEELQKELKVADPDRLYIVHFATDKETGEATPEVIENESTDITVEKNKLTEAAFTADSFSVFAVVYATLEDTVIDAEGDTWKIAVTYGEDAKIPDGAKLKVREITEDDEDYASLYDSAAEEACSDAEKKGIDMPLLSGTHLFDIEIQGEDGKIEPAAPVQVDIRLVGAEAADHTSVIHFGKDGAEALKAQISEAKASDKNEADGTDISFRTDSFSVYTVVNVTDFGSIAESDKKYALVSERGTNITSADGKLSVSNFAMISSMRSDTLSGKGVYKDGNSVGGYVTEWGFEKDGDQYRIYTIVEGAKKYVAANGNNLVLSDSGTPFQATVTNNKIRFSYNGRSITSTGDNPSAFKLEDNNGNASLFNLCEVDPDYEEKTARKVSAADWKAPDTNAGSWNENDTIVIYRRIEHADGSEELYAVATDGSLIPAYDGGDSIYYHCPAGKSVDWHLVLGASGYYISNVQGDTPVYLAPSVTNGTWSSDTPMGLYLNGLGSSYGTPIESWDQAAYAYAGLHVDPAKINQGVTPGSGDASDTFLFAVSDTLITEGTLHPVSTVDSASKGITMKIFNYGGGTYHYGYRNNAMQAVMGDDMRSDWDNRKSHVTQTVENTLGADGFPVSLSNGKSYAPLFTVGQTITYDGGSTTVTGGDANNLFLQSYYDENGMFRYSSMENFAHYDSGSGKFTVYREAGTPNIPTANDHYYYYHGHFMPYNTLDPNVSVSRIVDQYGSVADKEEGRSFENVYGLAETPDYYVGMSLEANFSQPSNGTLENGDPVVYRFTGDDDLLVYIDGILVLDVGGIHEPLTGSINFETGVVSQPNFYGQGAGWQNYETTLYQIFRKAHNNGDISDADWAKMKWRDADGDGVYDTFADHTTHSFNMFYMERGAGASNLDLQFNLQVVKKDEFTVRKALPEGIDSRFANQEYKFKAYFIDDTDNGTRKPLFPGATKKDGTVVCEKVIYEGLKNDAGQPIEKDVTFDPDDHSFTLRAGEGALFRMANAETVYDVEEIGIDSDLIEKVEINGEEVTINEGTVSAGEDSVEGRSNVNVVNHPSTQNLRITKHITEDSVDGWEADNPVFEFRVYLESLVTEGDNTVRKLIPYSYGPYYLVKIPDGKENDESAWEYYTLTGPNNSPVKQDGKTLCSATGRSGTINSIPPEYTIIIPNLVVGTNFYVEERRVNIPEGYEFDHEELEKGTYDTNNLGTNEEIISYVLTRDSYNEVDGWEFDPNTIGRIKKDIDAHDHVWNRKPKVDIPVEKIWNDGNASDRPDNVTLALIRYKTNEVYTPPEGKGAILIEHTADYGPENPSTVLPEGFVATYTIEDASGNVVATGSSGPFDVDPGTYKVITYVNNRGTEPANYTYNDTPIVGNVVVEADESTTANVVSTYKYERGGEIEITHASAGLPDTTELPEGFSATYTITDEDSNRVLFRNVPIGTYTVPAGTYKVTASVSSSAAPENYVYESTTPVEGITVASDGHETAALTSTYIYVKPKSYGYISFNHVSEGIEGVSPNLPEGFQIASYRIVGPTTINNAQPGREYEVEAGEYRVVANVNLAPNVNDYIYVSTQDQNVVVGTGEHKTATLTSTYGKQGSIHIIHTGMSTNGKEVTLPSDMSAQFTITNADTGETVRSNAPAGTYSVPPGTYNVTATVHYKGTDPAGYCYQSTEPATVTVTGEQTVDANVISRYGTNGTITISHISEGLRTSPALPDGLQVKYTIIDKDTEDAVRGLENVDAGTYSVAPGEYTVRLIVNYRPPVNGYTYNEEESVTEMDVTVTSDTNTPVTLKDVYTRDGGDNSKVYLTVGTSVYDTNRNSEPLLTVPTGSTITLKYRSYTIDHGTWTETINPSWELHYWNGNSWTKVENIGGNPPDQAGVDIELGDESVYCVWINTSSNNSGPGKLEESLELKSSPTASTSSLSAVGRASIASVRRRLTAGNLLSSLLANLADAEQTPNSLTDKGAAPLRATPVNSEVDPTTLTVPESVTDEIASINEGLNGYEYVLDTSFGRQVLLSDPWSYIFENLEEVGQNGHPYYYALVEVEVPDEYTLSYTDNPVSAKAIRDNMDAIAAAEKEGTTPPAQLTMTAINAKDVQTGSLIVEKKVSGREDTENAFSFEISLRHSSVTVDGTYTTVKTKADNTVDSTVTSITVSGGKATVTLKANEKFEIKDLPGGTEYTVTETGVLPSGYTQGTHVGASGTVGQGEIVTATMNNVYSNTIGIIKIDEETRSEAEPTRLDGAKFRLSKYNVPEGGDTGSYIVYPDASHCEKTTNTSGKLTFEGLPDGRYLVEEIQPPTGYISQDEVKVYFTIQNGVVVRTDESGAALEEQTAEHGLVTYEPSNNTFTVGNTPGAALPHTGGIGTTIFYILGSVLAIGCAVVLIARRRLRRD